MLVVMIRNAPLIAVVEDKHAPLLLLFDYVQRPVPRLDYRMLGVIATVNNAVVREKMMTRAHKSRLAYRRGEA